VTDSQTPIRGARRCPSSPTMPSASTTFVTQRDSDHAISHPAMKLPSDTFSATAHLRDTRPVPHVSPAGFTIQNATFPLSYTTIAQQPTFSPHHFSLYTKHNHVRLSHSLKRHPSHRLRLPAPPVQRLPLYGLIKAEQLQAHLLGGGMRGGYDGMRGWGGRMRGYGVRELL